MTTSKVTPISTPRPEPLGPGEVTVADDAILIERLRVDDPPLVRLVEERQGAGTPAAETVRRSLEVGARALAGAGATVSVEQLRATLEGTAAQAGRSLADTAERLEREVQAAWVRHLDPEAGALSRSLSAHSSELARLLSERFGSGGNGAVQGEIAGIVSQAMERELRQVVAALTSSEGGPLAEMRAQVSSLLSDGAARQQDAIERLREGVGQLHARVAQLLADAAARNESADELAAERERSPAKGFVFEDAVIGELARLAELHEDTCRDVSDEPAPSGAKVGDAVCDIDGAAGTPAGRIVVEVKHERLSWAKASALLDEAMAQRGADYALLVVREETCLPSGVLPFYEAAGRQLVVAVPDEGALAYLALAYRYARLRVRLSRAGTAADSERIGELVARARQALDGARAVASALGGAARKVQAAREGLSSLVEGVESQLSGIERQLEAGERRAA